MTVTELFITPEISIPLTEIELSAIRSQGAGGQHVNKTSTGIHLRFDISSSSLPDDVKARLLQKKNHHLNKDGVLIIKSQQSRSQEQNKQQALDNLQQLIKSALQRPKPRKKTKPTRSSKEKRLQKKSRRGAVKKLRRTPPSDS